MHPTTLAAWVVPLAFALCDPPRIVEPPTRACDAHADCTGDEICAGPSEWQVCGIPPMEECASSEDCGDAVCHAVPDGCSRDGVGSECGPACDDTSCGDGFTCAASACVATSCEDGFACPTHQMCRPAPASVDDPIHDLHHGCRDISCTDDDVCNEGHVCVNGICQTGEGVCAPDEPAP